MKTTTKLVLASAIILVSFSKHLVCSQKQSSHYTQLQSSVTQFCSENNNDPHYPTVTTGIPGKRGAKGEKGDSSTYVTNEEKNRRFSSKLASLHTQLTSVQDENRRLKADLDESKETCNSDNQRLQAELEEAKEIYNNETQRLKADLDEMKNMNNDKINGGEDRIMRILLTGYNRFKLCGILQRPSEIEDSRFSASSRWDNASQKFLTTYHGRLFSTTGETYWHSGTNPANQWIQVDLKQNRKIYGIATQGKYDRDYWTTSYNVLYKADINETFRTIDEVFQGNTDRNTPVINEFPQPITARYFRINVLTYHEYAALRFELLLC